MLVATVGLAIWGDKLPLNEVETYFKSHQKNYDWLKDPTDINSASFIDTTFWDGLQAMFGCCGIDTPKDWDTYRPKLNTSAVLFPRSCCEEPSHWLPDAQYRLCGEQQIYLSGCHNVLKLIWNAIIIVLGSLSVLYFITAGIANLIRREIEEEEEERYAGGLQSRFQNSIQMM